MNDPRADGREGYPGSVSDWYQKDPTLAWAMMVGFFAAWIYVAPMLFNQGALEALLRYSDIVSFLGLTPYPQLYDDRNALYASAVVSLVLALAAAMPLVVRRVLTWWTVLVMGLSLLVGLVLIFLWVPRYPLLFLVLAVIATIGGVCVSCGLGIMGPLAKPAGWLFPSNTAKLSLVVVAMIEFFLIIPAASGSVCATRPARGDGDPLYLLLHMKNPASPLHEAVVELIAATTDHLLVMLSHKVQHPRQKMMTPPQRIRDGPSTFSVGPVYVPMLVRRESIDIITPSPDPDVFVGEVLEMLSRFGITTQPSFRADRGGAAVKVRTEYPTTDTPLSTQPVQEP